MAEKVVVIYSGGMDSFTLLNRLLRESLEVYALTFNYGQRHKKEIDYASEYCKKVAVDHKVIDLSAMNVLLQGSSLTSSEIEVAEGHYNDESMKNTVVPNRNMIMLSLAIAYAVSIGSLKVYYGAHSGDHAIYPDCRPEFVKAMQDVAKIANYEEIDIEVPYLDIPKDEILKEGLSYGLDYSQSWTCYNGRDRACGKCGACVERLEAFTLNNAIDPLEYEDGNL